MEIFNNYYAKNSFRGMCTVQKNIWMTFRYFYVFLYETVSFIFAMGLILVPLSVFWKKTSLSKVMEISNNYYATISFRGMCTVQEMMTFQYFDSFLYDTFSLIVGLGLDFGSASCDSKLRFYTIFSSFLIYIWLHTCI